MPARTSATATPPDTDRRRWLVAWVLGTGVALAGCATGPRTVTLSDTQLSARLAAQFPLERRWLEVFDVRLSDPVVRTLPARNRVRTEVELSLGDRVFNRRFTARLALEARVRFEPADHSLRLHEVTVDAFTVDGADASLLERTGRLPAMLVAPWLEDATIYRLGDEQVARLRREGATVQGVVVTDRGLQFTLVPSR